MEFLEVSFPQCLSLAHVCILENYHYMLFSFHSMSVHTIAFFSIVFFRYYQVFFELFDLIHIIFLADNLVLMYVCYIWLALLI